MLSATQGNAVASAALPAAVEETLRTIERRARHYRRFVQVMVLGGFCFAAAVIFAALSVLLYLPCALVLLFTLWVIVDANEVRIWRNKMIAGAVAPTLLQLALKSRNDVPQATLAAMFENGLAPARSESARLFACFLLGVALALAARTIQTGSGLWGSAVLVVGLMWAVVDVKRWASNLNRRDFQQ